MAEALRALIVDDEALARKGMRMRLDALGGVDVVGEAKNGREAVEAIREHAPDVVFLDIEMPGMDGFDVVRTVQADQMPEVVFVTAFGQYALDAFDICAVDYVLKPVDPERLDAAVARARERCAGREASAHKEQLMGLISRLTGRGDAAVEQLLEDAGTAAYPDRITIRDAGEVTFVPVTAIDWVDAAGDYMCIHANGDTHVMRITMKELEGLLDPVLFQRIHRSTLINVQRVAKLVSHINGEYWVVLDCGARLKMSRSHRDVLAHLL